MLTILVITFRLILSAVLGSAIGFEREMHGRAAGLRTHTLVCLASGLIMLTSIKISEIYGLANCDPARIAAGVVTGIGFLGAGTILQFKASVRGLTTAASLWAAGAIGLAVGTGFYGAAIIATLLILATLVVFSRLERSLIRKDWYRILVVDTKGSAEQIKSIRSVLANYQGEIKDFAVERSENEKNLKLKINLKLLTDRRDEEIVTELMKLEGVDKVNWE